MKITITFLLVFYATLAWAQPDYSGFLDKFERGSGAIATRNPEIAFILFIKDPDSQYTVKEEILNKFHLASVQPQDSLHPISKYPGGSWVRKRDGKNFTIEDLGDVSEDLPKGAFIVPAYQIGKGRGDVFVPLPNVLVIDRSILNSDLKNALKRLGMAEDKERSKIQIRQVVYKVVKGNRNALSIRKELLELDFIRNKNLEKHFRFENLPFYSEMHREMKAVKLSVVDQWNITAINAQPQSFRANPGVSMGILDCGCDLTNTILNVDRGINLSDIRRDASPVDSKTHGTQVAGVIAMQQNTMNILGVCPGIRIIPAARESMTDVEFADGIDYLVRRDVSVINMSVGRYPEDGGEDGIPWDFANIEPSLEEAHHNNIVIVAATGNDNQSDRIIFPARHPMVMAVGASDRQNMFLAGTNYGDSVYHYGRMTGVSVVAPGIQIQTTYPGGFFVDDFGGTSAAAPHVAGLAALIMSAHPGTFTNEEIRNIIELTADRVDAARNPFANMPGFPNGKRNEKLGYGLINVAKALQYAQALTTVTSPVSKAEIFSVAWESGKTTVSRNDQQLVVGLKYLEKNKQRVYAAIVPNYQSIAFERRLKSEGKLINLVEKLRDSASDSVRRFIFNPEQLDSLSNKGEEWEVIVVAQSEKQFDNYADLRSEILANNKSIAHLVFKVDPDRSWLTWLFAILLLILIIVLLKVRKKIKDRLGR